MECVYVLITKEYLAYQKRIMSQIIDLKKWRNSIEQN